MQTTKNLFVSETMIALWRADNAHGPRMNHLRLPPCEENQQPDITPVLELVNGESVQFVLPHSGGISLWDGKHPGLKSGKWYEIPAGSQIPDGLCITKDGEPNRHGLAHYTVRPVYKMPLDMFIKLLDLFGKRAQKRF